MEPPHKPFTPSKYLKFNYTPYLEKKYSRIFEEYLKDSEEIHKIDEIKSILPKDIDYFPKYW